MSVVGFDFGNNSCVIAIARKGSIEVIMNDCSNRQTPSIVGYGDTNRYIGEAGGAQQISNYRNTVTDVKRLIGRNWNDPELQQERASLPFQVIQNDAEGILIDVAYNGNRTQLTPEQVTASLFGHLKILAEKALDGVRVFDCVIAVPPYFNDKMRRAVLDAANIAGLNVLRLMNETAAIALQYGLLRSLPAENPIKVMFFDMGHSNTNVALVSFIAGKLTVLATASHRNLGGRDFDRVISNHIARYAQEKYRIDVSSNVKANLRLFKACERIKKMLSANSESPYNIECLMNDIDVKGKISRDEFEALCAPLFQQMLIPVQKVLQAAGVEPKEIDSIEVLGGGSRVPAVRRNLQDFLGKQLMTTCNAEESVARGCALQCAMLSPKMRVREFTVQDVSPFAITVGWGPVDYTCSPQAEEENTILFTQFNSLPSIKQISFAKGAPFQLVARYAESDQLPPGTSPILGRFVVNGIPEGIQTKQKIKIKLDMNGLLALESAKALEEVKEESAEQPAEAMDVSGGAEHAEEGQDDKKKKKFKRTDLQVDVSLMAGLTAQEIQRFNEVEVEMSNQDRVVAETAEKRNELESYVYETRNSIQNELKDYIRSDIADQFVNTLNETEDWLLTDEGSSCQKSEYVRRLKELKAIGDAAVRRKFEHENRERAVGQLKATVTRYQTSVGSDPKYSHIEQSEKDRILAFCNQTEDWLTQVQAQQDRVPLSEDPVFTCDSLEKKRREIENLADPILSKPKPQPAPQPAQPAQPAADAQPQPQPAPEASANSQQEAKMDVEN